MQAVRRIFLVLLSAVLVLVFTAVSTACPNCKEAVSAQPDEVAGMADGYNWSVLMMLAVPFTLAGTGTMMVVRAAKRGTLPEL
jgi:hypothetical protein